MPTIVEYRNNIVVNQNQYMIDQKNRMDPPTTVHHHLENEVDFELLWRCISKIWNQFGMATYTREIVIIKQIYSLTEFVNV